MVIVGRHINGISLNGLEYLLDETQQIKTFQDKDAAVKFLRDAGATDAELEWLTFEEVSQGEVAQ